MYIKTEYLHSRQIVRSPRFAQGSRWRSKTTGKELVMVGRSGDDDDTVRVEAMYAIEYFDGNPNRRDYPELDKKPLGGVNRFFLARRVDGYGRCRSDGDVLYIPYHGRHGIYGVDLIGYGPTEWLPDGISGQECEERPREGWKGVLWPRPERMVSIVSLQYGWVVRSEQFARAKRRLGERSEGILTMYMDQEKILDASRGEALWVVSSIVPHENVEWDDGGEDYSDLDIRFCRLRADRTYDCCGEIIELRQHAHRARGLRNYPFQPVEFVGLMSFDDASFVLAAPPRPLHF